MNRMRILTKVLRTSRNEKIKRMNELEKEMKPLHNELDKILNEIGSIETVQTVILLYDVLLRVKEKIKEYYELKGSVEVSHEVLEVLKGNQRK